MGADVTKEDLVAYYCEDHIGYISLNSPEKRNALNPAVWTALGEAVEKAYADPEARVVLLVGKGKSFCAGLDLSMDNELFAMATGESSASQKNMFFNEIRRVQEIHTRLEKISKPTIAVIQKHCLGAGLEMVLCTDIRLCSEGTIFSMPEAKLGFITDVGGLQRLPKIVGPSHAREISFRGHRFDSKKALAINLVNEVYESDEALQAGALEMAREIAANPPLAVQGAKDVFMYNEEVGLDQALEYNAARSCMIVPSEDMSEAISSFLEKRTGKFKGA